MLRLHFFFVSFGLELLHLICDLWSPLRVFDKVADTFNLVCIFVGIARAHGFELPPLISAVLGASCVLNATALVQSAPAPPPAASDFLLLLLSAVVSLSITAAGLTFWSCLIYRRQARPRCLRPRTRAGKLGRPRYGRLRCKSATKRTECSPRSPRSTFAMPCLRLPSPFSSVARSAVRGRRGLLQGIHVRRIHAGGHRPSHGAGGSSHGLRGAPGRGMALDDLG